MHRKLAILFLFCFAITAFAGSPEQEDQEQLSFCWSEELSEKECSAEHWFTSTTRLTLPHRLYTAVGSTYRDEISHHCQLVHGLEQLQSERTIPPLLFKLFHYYLIYS